MALASYQPGDVVNDYVLDADGTERVPVSETRTSRRRRKPVRRWLIPVIVGAVTFFLGVAVGTTPVDPTTTSAYRSLANELTDAEAALGTETERADRAESRISELDEEASLAQAAAEEAQAEVSAAKAEAAAASAASAVVVTRVIDGDTVELDNGDEVRLIGIDAPERGSCGYEEATARLTDLSQGKAATLEPGASDDMDKYDRLLRYLVVGGTDAGEVLLSEGLAVPRYNSSDGYGAHPKEAAYAQVAQPSSVTCTQPVPAPQAQPQQPAPVQQPAPQPAPAPVAEAPSSVYFKNCSAARAAGAAPVYVGRPGYGTHLDRDGDGVGCE